MAMTKDLLAEQLAERAEITMTAAKDEVKWFFDAISEHLSDGNDVAIHGFGSFKLAQRPARTARNPKTGATVKVAARRAVRFTPSSTLKTAVNETRRGRKRA